MTPARLAQWDALARQQGLDAAWRLTDDEREARRQRVLAGRGRDHDLWVFGVGSLMWDPAFRFEEVRLARAAGYRRSFCIRAELGRGSPQAPALFLALERGGGCAGLAYRVAARRVEEESAYLWAREMITGSYAPAFIALETPQGPLEAIAFIADRGHHSYVPDLAPGRQAAMIAAAAGTLGGNADYLLEVARHLRLLGLSDAYVFALEDRVRGLLPKDREG